MSKKVIKRIFIGLFLSIAILILSAMLFLGFAYTKAKLNMDMLTIVNSGIKLYSSNFLNEQDNFMYLYKPLPQLYKNRSYKIQRLKIKV